MALTEARLGEVFKGVLESPGNYVCKLFRNDGIIQTDPIQQLYANWYRTKPYEYITDTVHEFDLSSINDYIQDNQSIYLSHIQECHNGDYETLHHAACSPDCSSDGRTLSLCVCCYVKAIHNVLVEHFNAIQLNVLTLGNNNELCDKLCEEYAQYVTALIVLENHLPSLSEMLSNMRAKSFRFSLWKFLHQEFVDLLLSPLLSQLMDGLWDKLKACRRYSIAPALNAGYVSRQRDSIDWTRFELMASLRTTLTMLVNGDLDERSVHTLESTKGDLGAFYETFEQQLQEQTQRLYEEYRRLLDGNSNWKVAIANDCAVLEKVLKPRSIRVAIEACLSKAQELWTVEETLFCHNFAAERLHDLDVDMYYHKLVTLPLSSSL